MIPLYKSEVLLVLDTTCSVALLTLYNMGVQTEAYQAVVYRGGGVWGVQTPPKFRSFDKAAFDCKLSGKCLVFLFQHPN